MVEVNGMKKKDESKNENISILNKADYERPLPGIITTTEAGPLRGKPDNPKTVKQKGKDSN
ncbi:MAG: hypothetical protein Q7U60_11840 [Candidatus Methanoperedens sp.]|nr:hypothetical protein [Candidatus Methanoperedens sp.]